jgi:BirA family transcriptional regulator, biotin operon repressor / biotin---[acetyl-CoA-carboxylase] ligase
MMPRMWTCERLASIDSTQLELQRRLAASPGPMAVWTTQQTAGMGSHGRPWKDSPDGLAWSAAWPLDRGLIEAGAWPARLSLMTLETLEELYPVLSGRLGLKWPNDVMGNSGKLCGVLASRHRVSGKDWLIAGIGINLSWPIEPDLNRPVADLRSLGVKAADPEQIANALCAAVERLCDAPSNSRWSADFSCRDIFLGRQVAVVHPHSGQILQQGLHQGVDAQGRLCLFCDGTVLPVQIGELSLRSVEELA